jgi:hypothetical protein
MFGKIMYVQLGYVFDLFEGEVLYIAGIVEEVGKVKKGNAWAWKCIYMLFCICSNEIIMVFHVLLNASI